MKPQMSKINPVITLMSLVIGFVLLIISITQARGVQIIFTPFLYSNLDKNWLFLRSIVFVIISIFAFIIQLQKPEFLDLHKFHRFLGVFFLIVLVTSIFVFYGNTCCDSPVVIHIGFPFSWLQGITPAQHRLPMPVGPYLFQNFLQTKWNIDVLGTFLNLLFWYNLLLVLNISKRRIK